MPKITASCQLTFLKNAATIAISNRSTETEVSGAGVYHGRQSIGTTAEQLNLPDVGTEFTGMVYLRNLDGTNYVEVGDGSATPCRINAGEWMGPVRWYGGQLWLQAHTAACVVEIFAASD